MKVQVSPGQRYGRLTVLHEGERRIVPSKPYGMRTVWCVCECGTVTHPTLQSLRNGDTESCGCGKVANLVALAAAQTTHGHAGHPLYATWRDIWRRCADPSVKSYKDYGGRGIRVCEEWRDVAQFIAWVEANLGSRPEGREMDRVDTDGDYAPGNVRWATRAQNNVNRRKTANTSSRFVGVTRKRNRWQAQMKVNYRHITLGVFASEEDAARAYDRAAQEEWGPFVRLNFPEEAAVSESDPCGSGPIKDAATRRSAQ